MRVAEAPSVLRLGATDLRYALEIEVFEVFSSMECLARFLGEILHIEAVISCERLRLECDREVKVKVPQCKRSPIAISHSSSPSEPTLPTPSPSATPRAAPRIRRRP